MSIDESTAVYFKVKRLCMNWPLVGYTESWIMSSLTKNWNAAAAVAQPYHTCMRAWAQQHNPMYCILWTDNGSADFRLNARCTRYTIAAYTSYTNGRVECGSAKVHYRIHLFVNWMKTQTPYISPDEQFHFVLFFFFLWLSEAYRLRSMREETNEF